MTIIQCEKCNGTGIMPGNVCDICSGAGIGIVYKSQVLFFGIRVNGISLFLRQLRRILRIVFVLIVGVFGIMGIVVLLLEALPDMNRVFTTAFWGSAGRGKMLFAISLLTDLYLVMRVFKHGKERKKVVKISKKEFDSIPSTWEDVTKLSKKQIVEVSVAFSDELSQALRIAYKKALKFQQSFVGLPQLFIGLLSANSVVSALARLEINPKELNERVVKILDNSNNEIEPEFDNKVKQALIESYYDAQVGEYDDVQAYHVLFHTINSDERIKEIFFDLGVDDDKLKNIIKWFEINYALHKQWRQFRGAASRRPKGIMNRAMTAVETQFLDRFSDDITLSAGRGSIDLIIGREKEFEEIFRILQGEQKSILLIGPHGIGKQSIINGIAEKMVEEEVSEILSDRRLVALSLPKLIAGARLEEAQERMLGCLADVGRARNVVLAIPNVHEAMGGIEGGLDLGEVLATEMKKGYFLSIATTTPEEYRKNIEGTSLGSLFIKINIAEPEINTAIHIVESKSGMVEAQTKVYFSYNALEKSVILSNKYLKEGVLPEKAIDIMKEVAQHVAIQRGSGIVKGEDVAEIISAKSKIPVSSVSESEADKLMHLEKAMHERVIGQDEAIKVVSAALRRARAGLREGTRPIANFLFLGSTGVGKTETAKTVAEVYFGSEKSMVRIDMSEFQNKEGLDRLIGTRGEKGGVLTEAVRKSPFTLVLLDEIEKAHPDILNIFLQVMDDGRLTDNAGRTIDFTNTIVIMTSNAGTQFVQDSLQDKKTMVAIKKELINTELKQYFKPEFLNRFDDVVLYKPLTEPEILQIAKIILSKVAIQLSDKGIGFRATDEAIAELAHAGFDPKFGARPLKRVIQEKVNDSLANLILEGKVGRRDAVVLEKGGEMRVEKAKKL